MGEGPLRCCCFGTYPKFERQNEFALGAGDGSAPELEEIKEGFAGEEGPGTSEVIIQARPATRKVKRYFAKIGVSFLVLHCLPAPEGGCGLAVLVAQSSLAAMRAAEAEGKTVLVLCDNCVDKFLERRGAGRRDEELTVDQVNESRRVEKIFDVQRRKN